MATILATARYRNESNRDNLRQQIYSIILRRPGKVRAVDLDKIFGNKKQVRYAITRLTVDGRIKRVKGFGKGDGIEYFYTAIGK